MSCSSPWTTCGHRSARTTSHFLAARHTRQTSTNWRQKALCLRARMSNTRIARRPETGSTAPFLFIYHLQSTKVVPNHIYDPRFHVCSRNVSGIMCHAFMFFLRRVWHSFMTGRRPDTTKVWEFVDHFREKGVSECVSECVCVRLCMSRTRGGFSVCARI